MMTTFRLPLHSRHQDQGAKFGTFGSWEVPLYYSSILEEHHAVRQKAGLFDISHMGEIRVEGEASAAFLEALLPRKISNLPPGKAIYMPMLNHEGGILDDILVYRFKTKKFLLIVNASNADKDFDWILSQNPTETQVANVTNDFGLLALQGPKSPEILGRAFPDSGAGDLKYYHFKPWQEGMISRTGYTGEDGFELMIPLEKLTETWEKLMAASAELVPVGFGCRDTLRLEAGMLLHGHDMSEETTPLEAGLSWAIDLNKPDFIGKEALTAQQQKGGFKKLIGFEMVERGIPRPDYDISNGEKKIGKVTSGSFSPTLQKNIGLGYVDAAKSEIGNEIGVVIREKQVSARIAKVPFYKRKK